MPKNKEKSDNNSPRPLVRPPEPIFIEEPFPPFPVEEEIIPHFEVILDAGEVMDSVKEILLAGVNEFFSLVKQEPKLDCRITYMLYCGTEKQVLHEKVSPDTIQPFTELQCHGVGPREKTFSSISGRRGNHTPFLDMPLIVAVLCHPVGERGEVFSSGGALILGTGEETWLVAANFVRASVAAGQPFSRISFTRRTRIEGFFKRRG